MSLRDKPAFARSGGGIKNNQDGMTLREYAAIKLKVPDSGDEELDAMIRKSRRQELAGLAMQGIISEYSGYAKVVAKEGFEITNIGVARNARVIADALIAELDKGEDNAT